MIPRTFPIALRVSAAAVAALVISAGPASVQMVRAQSAGVEPLLGTWVFVPEKSTSDPDLIPFRRGTCRIQQWEGALRVTYDLVRLRGGITHLEWTGNFDGQDYPVQGIDSDVTNAYRRIDPRTYEIVQKVNGIVSLVERLRISDDGSLITTTAPLRLAEGKTRELITVYARQR